GMYKGDDKNLIGLPESPSHVSVAINLKINNTPSTITKDVIYRFAKPDKGELYRPFEIIPEASVRIPEKVIIVENDQQKNIELIVKAGRDNVAGFVEINHPKAWSVLPEKQNVSI